MAKPPSAKKKVDRQHQPERRHAQEHGVVIVARHDGQDTGAEAEQAAGVAPSHQLREEREGEPADEAEHGEQDHHLGGFLRRHLQQQHEQRRRPQRDAVDAGLRAGIAEPGDDQAARIFEEIEPVALDDRAGVGGGRQRQRGRFHLQRPGQRLARLLVAALAAQPARRFRHPEPDQQHQQRRQHADREQQPPLAAAHQGAHHRAEADAERDDAGHDAADPAALGGGHEFLHQRQVHAIQPADADADEEAHDREIDPAIVGREIKQAGGDREIQHGADEDLAAADAVGEPAPDIGADDGADTGTHQHDGRLAEGELPRPDQEGEHEADQEVVEEFQRVADDGGGEDLDLVAGQTRRVDRVSRTWRFPLAHVRFLSGRRACAPPMTGKATLSTRRTEEWKPPLPNRLGNGAPADCK